MYYVGTANKGLAYAQAVCWLLHVATPAAVPFHIHTPFRPLPLVVGAPIRRGFIRSHVFNAGDACSLLEMHTG
jgi:hypothetical protein